MSAEVIGAVVAGAGTLLHFVRWALPRVPQLASVFFSYWDEHGLGPPPPDLEAWKQVDAMADAKLAAMRPVIPTEPDK